MYGIKVKKNKKAGNIPSKNVKETEFALDVSELLLIPLKKNLTTSYNGIPSKPGNIIFFENLTTTDSTVS